jgi:hypothetical protein
MAFLININLSSNVLFIFFLNLSFYVSLFSWHDYIPSSRAVSVLSIGRPSRYKQVSKNVLKISKFWEGGERGERREGEARGGKRREGGEKGGRGGEGEKKEGVKEKMRKREREEGARGEKFRYDHQ